MTTATKAQRTQQRIVQVAVGQFAERGIRSTSIASIAKAAGVSPASVFGYFGSKEELFLAAADFDAAAIIEEVAIEFLQIQTSTQFNERWTVLWGLFMSALEAHPLLHRMLTEPETPVFPRILALPSVKLGIDSFADEIAAAQAAGIARPDVDPHVVSEGLTTIMIGVVLTHNQMGIASRPERLEAMLAVLNSTLRRCPPTAVRPAAAPAPVAAVAVPVTAPVDGDDAAASQATPQTKGERTRERILEVAVQLFAVTGSKGTSVAQIAREVGITPAAVFAHFSSKDDLFEAAYERDAWNMVLGLNEAMADVDIVDRWPAVVDAMWDTLPQYPLVQRVVLAKELDRVTQLLDSEAMRLGIVGMSERLAVAQQEGRARSELSPGQLAEGLVDIAGCLLVAQAQSDQTGEPYGWGSRLEVLSLAIRPEAS